jgi:hypothetical protein
MTKRDIAITAAKISGYHNDARTYTRLIVEARVRRDVMAAAWSEGVQKRAAGATCACFECKTKPA